MVMLIQYFYKNQNCNGIYNRLFDVPPAFSTLPVTVVVQLNVPVKYLNASPA